MKTDHSSFKLVFALIVLGAFIVLFSSARAAEAKPKAKHPHVRIGAFQSSYANSGTFASTVSSSVTRNAPGDVTRDTTVTNANGKTLEKEVATKINPDGTGTRVVEVTKPDGTTETRTETFAVTDPVASSKP